MKKGFSKKVRELSLVINPVNIRALTGLECDNAVLAVENRAFGDISKMKFFTDFRYLPMVRRLMPDMVSADIGKFPAFAAGIPTSCRIGFEKSISVARFEKLKKNFPSASFVDIEDEILALRAVKSPDEIGKIQAAAALNDAIWQAACMRFEPGMTERDMARILKVLMTEFGDGEAFGTIVCVGANAAECHHVPDDTVWDGKEPVLVDMGVKLDGYCSDMTRCFGGVRRGGGLYAKIYSLVKKANQAAIAAVRPGITCKALDKVARDIIGDAGYGRFFGHSLGHGVGLEVHEQPAVSKKSRMPLEPGMVVTIEPGVYLEGRFGVRIEDLVLVTETGCEVLSSSPK